MNIKTHFVLGVLGAIILKSETFLVGSIILDFPLLVNEYKIWKKKKDFNPEDVSKTETILYRTTHSLLFLPIMFWIGGLYFCLGGLIHQIIDWFSHVGKFNTRILYPVSRKRISEIGGRGFEKVHNYLRRF